jgi:hypothetical protein
VHWLPVDAPVSASPASEALPVGPAGALGDDDEHALTTNVSDASAMQSGRFFIVGLLISRP